MWCKYKGSTGVRCKYTVTVGSTGVRCTYTVTGQYRCEV